MVETTPESSTPAKRKILIVDDPGWLMNCALNVDSPDSQAVFSPLDGKVYFGGPMATGNWAIFRFDPETCAAPTVLLDLGVSGATPNAGQVFHYLICAGNTCGSGSLGGAREARQCQ